MAVGLVTVAVGLVGLASPQTLTGIRDAYYATPIRFYAAGLVRASMGIIVMLAASSSRAPRMLLALGLVMALQATSATLLGFDRARSLLGWEVSQGDAVLRLGASGALIAGVFLVFALTGSGSSPRRKTVS